MKQEYKIKEVFDENAKTIQEKLQEIFINYLIEKVNKQLYRLIYVCLICVNQPKFVKYS